MEIRKTYYFQIIGDIFLFVCSIVVIVIMLTKYNESIELFGRVIGIIFTIFVVGSGFLLFSFSIYEMVILLKDFKSVKNNDYISIIGKVLKFEKNIDPDLGRQINDKPIVLILDTNEKIKLFINQKVKIGETYRFNYLKNSKIAEVVEKI